MASKPAPDIANGNVEAPKSDLALLWENAIHDYEQKTGKSLRLDSWQSMQEVIDGTESQVVRFKDFRHSGTKVDTVRTAFKNNLWLIQKIVNAIQIVGNAAAAFPPAMPAALIFNAFGQVMTSFNQMSADYDKVVGFFEFTQRFMDRLSMIEGRSPPLAPFQRCITRVFSSMLTICAVAQEYVKEKRFKKWFHTLVEGSSSDLAAAYSDMENAINEMSQAVGFATLRTVQMLADIVKSMEQGVDFVITKTTFIDERTKRIESKLDISVAQGQRMDSKQDVSITQGQVMISKQEDVLAIVKNFGSSLKTFTERAGLPQTQERDAKGRPGKQNTKRDPGENKRVALAQVKSYLSKSSQTSSDIHEETKVQRKEIRVDFARGTGSWLLEDEKRYKAWTEHEQAIVWLRGSPGIGKSYLAEAVITSLEKVSDVRKSYAYFFFREEEDKLRSFSQSCKLPEKSIYLVDCADSIAVYSMAYQLAETDPKYCEQLASEISSKTTSPVDQWRRLFADRFPSKGEDHCYLVLDGIDEMKPEELLEMVKCLDQVVKERLNIHVLLSGRPSISTEILSLNPSIIEITKSELSADIDRVIGQNLKKLHRLKRFPKPLKNHIRSKVRANADGMRYVDHMLRRLDMIGRERAVRHDLAQKFPASLEQLYDLMLKECQQNRTKEQYLTLKKLFAWLAYSKRPLTLDEAGELIKRTVPEEHTFDIEDEIVGRSARILEIVRAPEVEEDEEGETASDSDKNDEVDELDASKGGEIPLGFQERSLREYFQAVDVDENGLRTAPSAAHLTIFEMASSLLFNASGELKDSKHTKLLSYAANFWAQHFVEIDIVKATDEEVKRVVNILQRILSNHNNVARTFEHSADVTYTQMNPGSEIIWLETLKEWTSRAMSTPGLLDSEMEAWAKEVQTSQEPLLTLARGHVVNWYAQDNGHGILAAFAFARDAFKLSGKDVSEDSIESVLEVAEHFSDIEKTAGSMRAISAILYRLGLYDVSMNYVRQGLEMLESIKPSLTFYLHRSLSLSLAAAEKYEEAVPEVDKAIEAIEALPKNWKDDEDLLETVQEIYKEKGSYLNRLDRPEEAVEAYKSWISISLKPEGYYLDDMARIWTSARDPDCTKLLGLLRDWTEKERNSWFEYVFTYLDNHVLDLFNQGAAQNGEDAKSFLLKCFTNYIATIPPSADRIIFVWAGLARSYLLAIKNEQKAKELHLKILSRSIKDVDLPAGWVDAILYQARRSLAEIIFEQFRKSTDPAQKLKMLEEMKKFPSQRTDFQNEYQIESSNVSVMIALMHRVLGQATDFEVVMKKTFATCIAGLSDSVGWNDSSSFRLLAKVLACLEGLERDALIALSCQFSKVTEEPETETEKENEVLDKPPEDQIGEQKSEVEPIDENASTAGVPMDETARASADESESSEKKEITGISEATFSQTEHNHADGQIHYTETTLSKETIEDGVVTESSKITIEEASVEVPHEGDEGVPTTTSELSSEAKETDSKDLYEYEEKLPKITDEDLIFEGIHCDGECDRSWTSWEVPIYFCLVCTNADICPTCYNKRMALNRGEENDYWRSYCGENHRYAKGPIKGWRGVKGGIIRIEVDGVLKEFKVKEWLEELKNVRWEASWRNFWGRLEGVKDIGL